MGPRMPSHEVPVYRDPQVGSSASTASYEDILGSVDGTPELTPAFIDGLHATLCIDRASIAEFKGPKP